MNYCYDDNLFNDNRDFFRQNENSKSQHIANAFLIISILSCCDLLFSRRVIMRFHDINSIFAIQNSFFNYNVFVDEIFEKIEIIKFFDFRVHDFLINVFDRFFDFNKLMWYKYFNINIFILSKLLRIDYYNYYFNLLTIRDKICQHILIINQQTISNVEKMRNFSSIFMSLNCCINLSNLKLKNIISSKNST